MDVTGSEQSTSGQVKVQNEEHFYQVVSAFREVHVFLGYGERAQYAEPEEVLAELEPYLKDVEARCGDQHWLAIYGGDKSVESRPDLGWIMHCIHRRYRCKLMAVQSAGEPDTHTDYVFVAPQQFETVIQKDEHGQDKEVKQVLYGGTRDGRPVGGSRYYLGPQLNSISSKTNTRPLTCLWVAGGGGVARDELQYADTLELPWVYVPSRARNTAAYNSVYGPVHSWVAARFAEQQNKSLKGLVLTSNLHSSSGGKHA